MGVDAKGQEIVTVFRVTRPREAAFSFLIDPRNHFLSNRRGSIVEQSRGSLQDGSYYVLAFDQLRARVTYEVVAPPERTVVSIALSGRLSGGMRSRRDFLLHIDGDGTNIEVRSQGSGGWISWGPIVRAGERAAMAHLKRRIESA